jgi:hypothetical protein
MVSPLSSGPYPATRITVADLRRRWGKFDETELAAIEHRLEFVQKVQEKYGMSKEQADRDVEAWANGRVF